MSGLCGWFDPSRSDSESGNANDPALSNAIRDSHDRRFGAAFAPYGAATTSGCESEVHVFEDAAWAVVIWGNARFTDSVLATQATREGLAATLCRAFAVKQEGALATLSGSFAFAILDVV